jgi:hypothetical protein
MLALSMLNVHSHVQCSVVSENYSSFEENNNFACCHMFGRVVKF